MSVSCSFCDRSTDDIRLLLIVSSPGPDPKAWICDDCILTCGEMIVNQARFRKGEVLKAVAVLQSMREMPPAAAHPEVAEMAELVQTTKEETK